MTDNKNSLESYVDLLETPLGLLEINATEEHIVYIGWDVPFTREYINKQPKNHRAQILLDNAKMQLSEYFQGKRKAFDLPLLMQGTSFQIQAWRALQMIPYAQIISYKMQANFLGDAKKARAVGLANKRNQLAIVVPCHRVIGKNGDLVGYAGGLETKKFLLDLEARNS